EGRGERVSVSQTIVFRGNVESFWMLAKDASGKVVGNVETSIMKPFFLKNARLPTRLLKKSVFRSSSTMSSLGKGIVDDELEFFSHFFSSLQPIVARLMSRPIAATRGQEDMREGKRGRSWLWG